MAIDRHFFQSVGAYDPGMLLWGEEQIELSIRVKQTFFSSYQGFIQNPPIIHLLMQNRVMTAYFQFFILSHVSFFHVSALT